MLRDGTLFITTHLRKDEIRHPDRYTHSYVRRSTDKGMTWRTLRIAAEDVPDVSPKTWTHTSRNILELRDGSLILGVSGGSSTDYLWRSKDKGQTWDKSLPCKVEGFDVKKMGSPGSRRRSSGNPPTATSWRSPAASPGRCRHSLNPRFPRGETRSSAWPSFAPATAAALGPSSRRWETTTANTIRRSIRLQDKRLLFTFTVRSLRPPLGVQAILGVEQPDGFQWKFCEDRLILDDKTPKEHPSGGGFGNTIQLQDGTLVTSYTYRDAEGKTHAEVVRWRLPPRDPAKD